MSDQNEQGYIRFDLTTNIPEKNKPDARTIIRHTVLFVLTFISVAVMAGLFFVGYSDASYPDPDGMTYRENLWVIFNMIVDLMVWEGILFAALLLFFLGTHEFGHYFAAVRHNVSASLPYFIPLPVLSPIGTVGAVIKIKERINDTIKIFDIGIAGPLAGFVVSLGILLYGFATLPGPEFLANFPGHEDVVNYVQEHGAFPDEPLAPEGSEIIMLGDTILYTLLASFFDNVPPMWEMYHYPFLFAGWLGLFFTALNLMPVGQLDGGHILYALIGHKNHLKVARVFYTFLLTLGSLAAIPLLDLLTSPLMSGRVSIGWFLWAPLSFLILRRAFQRDPFWTLGGWIFTITASTLMLLFGDVTLNSGYGVWLFFALLILFLIRVEHPPVIFEQELDTRRKILGWLTMLIFILCISPTPFFMKV